uniref:BAH domain-containing protein n=1 Tax=Leersia perrieri TaxID=77586 RepID=A0A0D9W078_9ORYZ
MAKTPQPQKRLLESFTIKGLKGPIKIKLGDYVLLMAPDPSKKPYVARVEEIEGSGAQDANVKFRVRWYYRPEESIGGRQPFHGSKEVFLSDHYDQQSVDSIEGKCYVHNFQDYIKLQTIGAEDFFCRFKYKSATGSFIPDRATVFCKCEMPYNPDDLMVECEDCADWFHPSCVNLTNKEAKKLDHFYCEDCIAQNRKKLQKCNGNTSQSKGKCYKLLEPEGAATWDDALRKGVQEFQLRSYSLFTCNCHSFVANNLNRLFYSGHDKWNVVSLAAVMFLRGRWVSTASMVKTFLPFVLVLTIGTLLGGMTFLIGLVAFAAVMTGWFLVGTYCIKSLVEL